MAVRPTRRPESSRQSSPQYPQTLGAYSGMAQDGPARKVRPVALAEEILTRGCAFVEKGIWDDAEREFRKAIKMAADYPEAYNNLGLCMLFAGRPDEARDALREAVRLYPNWACAEANLGLVYQQLEQHDEAAIMYRQSLTHKSLQPQVNLSLGDAFNALGRAEDALNSYQKALEQVPHYALAHSRIGIIYARKGKINEAESALSRAVQLDPSNAEACSVLGAIAARRGNFRQAKDWFGKVTTDPAPLAAQRGAQRIALFEEAARKGLEEWKALQPPAKPLAMCYYDLGLALIADGNETDAQSMFQRAAQYDVNWSAPQVFLAFGAALEGDALLAKNALEVAVKVDPENGIIPEQLGYVALGMGMTKEADAQFKRAVSLGRELPPDLAPSDG